MRGFPDWRDAAAYRLAISEGSAATNWPDPRGVQWAWEFLRRNPTYQNDYKLWRSLPRSSAERRDIPMRHGLEDFMLPPSEASPGFLPFRATLALPEISSSRLSEPWLSRAFGLSKPDVARTKRSRTCIALVFDLTLPISGQLVLAERQLVEKRRHITLQGIRLDLRKRLRVREYPRYLRMLDAKAAGVVNRNIAKTFVEEGIYRASPNADNFYPGQARLEQDLKRARYLMREGYKYLPYL